MEAPLMGFNLEDYEPVAARSTQSIKGWESSATIGVVSAAIVEAVGDIDGVAKTRTAKVDSRSGSGYSYKYADLSDVIASTKAILKQKGLVALQTVASDETSVIIGTTLLHASGEWIAFEPLRLPLGRTAQEIGSAITYGRRYTLLGCLGIAAEDDDGASAVAHPSREEMAKVSRAGGGTPSASSSGNYPSLASEKQMEALRKMGKRRGADTDEALAEALSTLLGKTIGLLTLSRADASTAIGEWTKE